MAKQFALAAGLLLAAGSLPAPAQTRALTCDELEWSTAVLAANPDVRQLCQGVYVKGETYYAKAVVRVTRSSGNRITFRPLRTDGTLGKARSTTVPASWRVTIGDQKLTARDLLPGQELTVYIPQDRFAIAVQDADGLQADDLLSVD